MAHKFIMLSHPPCAVVPTDIFFREIPAYTVIVIFISQDVLSPKSMNSPFCPFTVFKTFFFCNLQMIMFRTRLLLERMGMYDQYQDWRLDVDNMTYEVPSFCIYQCVKQFVVKSHRCSHFHLTGTARS
jgi:hypothetical protein